MILMFCLCYPPLPPLPLDFSKYVPNSPHADIFRAVFSHLVNNMDHLEDF